MTTAFADMRVPTPDPQDLQRRYDALLADWHAADDDATRLATVAAWDALRRELATWANLASVRFRQDTSCAAARADRDLLDELGPRFRQWDAEFQLALLGSPHAGTLAEVFSPHVLDLWRADSLTTSPDVAELLVAEGRLTTRYTRLTAGASVDFRGRAHSMAALSAHRGDPDRDLREQAERARWGWHANQQDELDALYHELVELRTRIGRGLGQADFVPVGYARKRRTDYDRDDVARFRDQLLEQVVPLVSVMREQQRQQLGLEQLRVWDEPFPASGPPPRPRGDLDAAADELFAGTLPELHALYRDMSAAELLDLRARDGKAPGGFCTSFPNYGTPFIFANWNGTHDDVRVFTHEMGHAFQRQSCNDHALFDTMGCTSETAEIHSMSLEFLTWPGMPLFFGADEAERFCRVHLSEQLSFLPYAALVDDFQHRVYDDPELSGDERAALWAELETLYLPWRDNADIAYLRSGRGWQRQLHIYLYPFYYIDYALALTCALQLWDQSRSDRAGAWQRYHALCKLGGRLPFRQLTARAGLANPFAPGSLDGVLTAVREALELGSA